MAARTGGVGRGARGAGGGVVGVVVQWAIAALIVAWGAAVVLASHRQAEHVQAVGAEMSRGFPVSSGSVVVVRRSGDLETVEFVLDDLGRRGGAASHPRVLTLVGGRGSVDVSLDPSLPMAAWVGATDALTDDAVTPATLDGSHGGRVGRATVHVPDASRVAYVDG